MNTPSEAVDAVEVQAIMALCHHSAYDPECERCRFRAAAGIEHITVSISTVIDSMGTNN